MKRYLVLMILFGLGVSSFAQDGKARRSDGTQCAALPCVVASVSLTDQAAPIPQTALAVPTADGLFRVTYYLESSHVKGSTWGVAFGWTDDMKTRGTGSFEAHAGSISTFSFNFRVLAAQPITYTVKEGNNNPPGTSYDLFMTVEQLQ